MRKGYFAERKAKIELQEAYGNKNVLKIAISQEGMDFLVIQAGIVVKAVEVKEYHTKKWYPLEKQLHQIQRVKDWCRSQDVQGELWLYKIQKGKKAIKEVQILWEKSIF